MADRVKSALDVLIKLGGQGKGIERQLGQGDRPGVAAVKHTGSRRDAQSVSLRGRQGQGEGDRIQITAVIGHVDARFSTISQLLQTLDP